MKKILIPLLVAQSACSSQLKMLVLELQRLHLNWM